MNHQRVVEIDLTLRVVLFKGVPFVPRCLIASPSDLRRSDDAKEEEEVVVVPEQEGLSMRRYRLARIPACESGRDLRSGAANMCGQLRSLPPEETRSGFLGMM